MSKRMMASVLWAGMLVPPGPAWSDSLLDLVPPESNPLALLREQGIDTRFSWAQFYGGLIEGPSDADTDWRYGGRGDLTVTIDGERLGLWDGFFINLHGEFVYGENVNTSDGNVTLPVNVAMMFPSNGEFDTDLSLNFTQQLGDRASLTFGKINMLPLAAKTPLVGGGGVETFQHAAFAAPPTGLVPAYIFGGMLSVRTDPVSLTFAVFDPVNAQNRTGLEDPFDEGVAGMITATFPVTLGGLPGFYGITVRGNNREQLNLSDLSDLLLPGDPVLGTKNGAYYVGFTFQQYLFQSDPTHGWGIFGLIGFSDANPTPLGGGATIGIAGNSPIPGREEDRFGIGYFYNFYSDALVDALAPIANIGSEQGVEAFYNFQVAPGVYFSTDLQVIDPAIGDDIDVFGGFRIQTIF